MYSSYRILSFSETSFQSLVRASSLPRKKMGLALGALWENERGDFDTNRTKNGFAHTTSLTSLNSYKFQKFGVDITYGLETPSLQIDRITCLPKGGNDSPTSHPIDDLNSENHFESYVSVSVNYSGKDVGSKEVRNQLASEIAQYFNDIDCHLLEFDSGNRSRIESQLFKNTNLDISCSIVLELDDVQPASFPNERPVSLGDRIVDFNDDWISSITESCENRPEQWLQAFLGYLSAAYAIDVSYAFSTDFSRGEVVTVHLMTGLVVDNLTKTEFMLDTRTANVAGGDGYHISTVAGGSFADTAHGSVIGFLNPGASIVAALAGDIVIDRWAGTASVDVKDTVSAEERMDIITGADSNFAYRPAGNDANCGHDAELSALRSMALNSAVMDDCDLLDQGAALLVVEAGMVNHVRHPLHLH